MTEDLIQRPGIYFRSGEKPPPHYRLLLLNVTPGARPIGVHDGLARIYQCLNSLRAGQTVDLGNRQITETAEMFDEVGAVLGFGRALFDSAKHEPSLTEMPRPDYLVYLDQRGNAFPSTEWARTPPANAGEADIALQLTGPSAASVNCVMVELWKLIVDEGLPFSVATTFAGFGRPDRRGWLDFHDGVSNLASSRRAAAIEAPQDHGWMAGGTYLAFLRFMIDVVTWRSFSRATQELLVGRDKDSGFPLEADPNDEFAFRDPPETTSADLKFSHVHRANQSRATSASPGAFRIYRQGYDFLDGVGPSGPQLGLNFVSFQSDLATLQHLLHMPGWLGDTNFGGRADSGTTPFITLADGGFYAIPPIGDPFPGANLFTPTNESSHDSLSIPTP